MTRYSFDRLCASAQVLPDSGGRVEVRLADPDDGILVDLVLDGRCLRKLARLLTRVGAEAMWDEELALTNPWPQEG